MNWVREVERLERLAFDLRQIASNGDRPTIDQLMSAPTLADWREEAVLTSVLTGFAKGHPRLRAGPIVTSMVFAQGDGWARTWSRFYILEKPAS